LGLPTQTSADGDERSILRLDRLHGGGQMKRMRLFLVLFALAALVPVFTDAALQTQRAQITVDISVQVTNPLGMRIPAPNTTNAVAGSGIVADFTVNPKEVPPRTFSAENVSLVPGTVVAQAVQQGGIEVRASMSPNPTGTLLYGGCTAVPIGCPGIMVPATAGAVTTVSCAYTVNVDTTVTNWTLQHGLFSDFESTLGAVAFSGHLMFNNSHVGTPLPSYTPFIVFSDGQSWVNVLASGGVKSMCVDLRITVPTSVLTGTYNSNATYTLLY
jgi:hypothetical protein